MKKLATLSLAVVFAVAVAAPFARAQEKSEPAGAAAGQQQEEEGGGMEGWKWANFVLLAVGLGWLTAKNAGPFFAARSQKIRQEISDADEVRRDAEERTAAVSLRLANLESEIAALREQSKGEEAAEAQRIAKRTEAEIAKIREHADSEIAAAGKAARAELKRYAAHLAVTLAEQQVRTRMTSESQDTLVNGFVQALANPSARAQAL